MSYDDSEHWEPVRVIHRPLSPPRECTPGEGIYLALWKDFATARPREWRYIFSDMRIQPRQRVASVACSFMTFMGCNGGAAFTYRAEKMAEGEPDLNRARIFIAAWAVENDRRRGVNHGLRLIEYMLAPKHPIENHPFCGRRIAHDLVPVITMDDIDTIECMVRWWSGDQAKGMRAIAEPMRESENKKRRSGLFTPEVKP